MRGDPIEVEPHFDRATSAWAKDRIWHPSQKASTEEGGCLTLVLQVADTPELLGWILSFGSGIRVVRPDSLRSRLFAAATAILQK